MKKAIYKITNQINGKVYVGQTNDPQRRFRDHISKNEKYPSLIHRAIVKYGQENFTFEIIGWFEDWNEKEKYYIHFFNSLSPNGYNISEGGNEPPHYSGEDNPFAKITNEQAKKIKNELQDYSIPRRKILKNNNISGDILRHINEGSSWHDEDLVYPLRPEESKLNKIRAEKVKELLMTTNLSQKEIGKIVGWNRSAITMINIGSNYFDNTLQYPLRQGKHYNNITCNDYHESEQDCY